MMNKVCQQTVFHQQFLMPFSHQLYTTQMSPSQLVRAGDDIYMEENDFTH